MNAKTLLKAARRILIEKEWVQGKYAIMDTAAIDLAQDYRLWKGRLVPSDQYDAVAYRPEESTTLCDGKVIPTSSIGAVCAIGALECALANKDYEGDTNQNITDSAVPVAKKLLERSILSLSNQSEYMWSRYEEWLWDNWSDDFRGSDSEPEDIVAWAAEQGSFPTFEEYASEFSEDFFDGVEGWNDEPDRTKREVIEMFDKAIALA